MFKINSIIRTTQYPHEKSLWRVLGFQTATTFAHGKYQILYCEAMGTKRNKVNLMSFKCKPYSKKNDEVDKIKNLAKVMLKRGNNEMAKRLLNKIKTEQ
jgi:hypothetical protein